jgi:serine/threonine-protein kinase
MSDPLEPPEPVTFGKYVLDAELARGGMSRVFRARLRGPGGFEKHLVVKQILPELAADPEFVKLFVKEANTLVQLSHPNLVPVFELGVVDGVYFLAMEWVQGATVEELLRQGPLPAALVAQIGAQIADALHYAHERFGIVHRDVTPRNVIVDGAGHARLLDFGIAARVENTGLGELFGSPGYMAPEQLRGEGLGPASDLFSLGCVLYEAIRGKPAWPQVRSAAQLEASEAPAPLDSDSADEVLRELIGGLLARDASARPQPASQVAERLRTWLSERHPRGLQGELAARVAACREQRQHTAQQTQEPPRVSSGRIEVRSIAVSKELTALLAQATEKIPREERAAETVAVSSGPQSQRPAERVSDDPELHRVARRFIRDGLLVTLALVVGVWWYPITREDDAAPQPTATRAPLSSANPQPAVASDDRPASAVVPAAEAPAAQAPEPAATDAAAATPKPEGTTDAPLRRGYLSVSAQPWAEVRVDGRLLGATPRRRVPLRAGKHNISLSCPPLARDADLSVELQPEQELHISANMHESPPAISTK